MNATEPALSSSLHRLAHAVLRRSGVVPSGLPRAYATPAPLRLPLVAPSPPQHEPLASIAGLDDDAHDAIHAARVDPSSGPTASLDALGGLALTVDNVEAVLDEMVRPALNADGGDIQLVEIKQDDIYVKLVGACSSCPSSIMTMKMGVERLLQDEFPSMGELISVDALAPMPSAWG